jgi:hypothetical protein
MTPPYQHGHPVAWIETDPQGVRVHRASINTIEPALEPDHWLITTDRGTTAVDQTGVGSNAVPLDPDIAEDLHVYGDGYLVTSTPDRARPRGRRGQLPGSGRRSWPRLTDPTGS